ncbi:MAG: protein kinase [Myxococcales bacterium]|nr:protein kinase [Myxococcales bacterium]
MTCTACGGEIEQEAAFCGICGSRLRARRTTLVGTVFAESYRIEEKLAEGGFGSIYRATHVASGLDCALKVLHAELAADESLAARFRREGATLSRLHDPHTVATYDVGEAADGTLFIAMELLRGESLHDRIAQAGTLHWRSALGIARQLCSALAEAHDLGIIHRDLKPANVHLSAGDSVKLLDFGIAKVTGGEADDGAQLTRMGQTVGTLEYMAPEQIIGAACEPRSDIYQLGVLMFEMVTGRRPFADAIEPTAMITALLTQVPPVPSSACAMTLPPALDELILRCLEREPEHRFPSVRELSAEIARVLGLADPAVLVIPADTVDEHTWIGGPTFSISTAPSLVPLGPPEVTPLPPFDVCVQGSVTEVLPLDPTGTARALALAATEPVPAIVETVEPPARDEPAAHMAFGTKVALWSVGLAAAGAAVGAGLGLLLG